MLEKLLEPSIIIGLVSLLVLSIEDIKEGYISSFILFGLLGYGLVNKLLFMNNSRAFMVDSFICLLMVVAILLLSHFSKGHFGIGDGMLLSAICLMFGWQFLVTNMVLAFLSVGVWGLVMILSKKGHKKTLIPFVPFVAVGFVVLITMI